MPRLWVPTSCALCGQTAHKVVLEIPHPDAPDGRSSVVECVQCGLRRLDPRPAPSCIGEYYAEAAGYNAFAGRRRSERAQRLWNFLRDGYSRPEGEDLATWLARPVTRPLARWLFDINIPLDRRSGLRVIEIGSGYGDLLIYLKARGCTVLGTDLSAVAAGKARDYGVEVRLGHLADLQLPPGSFDVAILCHSLEHVPDPNAELKELARILCRGGRLHIAVPNGHAVRMSLEGIHWLHLSHPFHFWFFDGTTLVRLLEQHGFRPIRPPQTTTRHHALGAWRHDARTRGWRAASKDLARFARESLRVRDGGDVLRVVAERL